MSGKGHQLQKLTVKSTQRASVKDLRPYEKSQTFVTVTLVSMLAFYQPINGGGIIKNKELSTSAKYWLTIKIQGCNSYGHVFQLGPLRHG